VGEACTIAMLAVPGASMTSDTTRLYFDADIDFKHFHKLHIVLHMQLGRKHGLPRSMKC
jgi:hypothetical protein